MSNVTYGRFGDNREDPLGYGPCDIALDRDGEIVECAKGLFHEGLHEGVDENDEIISWF